MRRGPRRRESSADQISLVGGVRCCRMPSMRHLHDKNSRTEQWWAHSHSKAARRIERERLKGWQVVNVDRGLGPGFIKVTLVKTEPAPLRRLAPHEVRVFGGPTSVEFWQNELAKYELKAATGHPRAQKVVDRCLKKLAALGHPMPPR